MVSVEHDERFCREDLPGNCECLFVPPELGEVAKDSAEPLAYYSARYAGFNFQAYASAIDDYDPFDLVENRLGIWRLP